jgi:hypothetical protein
MRDYGAAGGAYDEGVRVEVLTAVPQNSRTEWSGLTSFPSLPVLGLLRSEEVRRPLQRPLRLPHNIRGGLTWKQF